MATSTARARARGHASDAYATVFPGSGEMAVRCRAFDWAATSLGPVESWPRSLRTTVAIVLGARVPMFLWWGPDLIQFYNDAYRPSLGQGDRHPAALGAQGRRFWTDIWDAIGPQIEQVMTMGDATWHEDQYLPIERNGRVEDVWWTYGYSPVRDDDGEINGTLVVCQETTQRMLAERERERLLAETARAERRAARVLEQVSDEHITMDADFRILTINAAAERALDKTKDSLVGRTLWEAFPASVGSEIEHQYRRVQIEREEAHFVHHYVGEGYDHHLEIDAYPTDEGGIAVFWRDVSERMRAEQALRESETRLRAIYGGTYEYIGLISPDGTVIDCNRASLQFVGNTREDVVGKPFWDTPWFTHTPGAPELLRQSVARAAAGESIRYEATLHRPGAESLTFDFSLHPVRNATGDVIFIVPEGRDITVRQRAEAALRESDARYRTLFESLDESFCVFEVGLDAQGAVVDCRVLEANPALLRRTGFADVVGKRPQEILPGTGAYWFDICGRVVRTGEPVRFEAGDEMLGRWYDVSAFRVGPPEQRKVAVLYNDVSAARSALRERERLLGALELEQARLEEVFRRAPSFIAAVRGPEQVFEFVNEAYYQLVGNREILGKPLLEALPEIRDQGVSELLERVRTTGEPWVGRETPALLQRVPGAPPETRYLDVVLQPLTHVDGTRSGVVAHGSDVTEQVLARHEVERLLAESEKARSEAELARADAEAANRGKGEFLAVMSHELRTPLNAIGGYADLMEMGLHGPVTEQQRADLARIQQSQKHLLGLINQVLNYTRVETGTVHYDLIDVPVSEALAAAEALVVPQVRAKGLSYLIAGCDRRLRVRADREKLQQILLNLLTNAIKFTDAGEIRVACPARPGIIAITVSDTGVGIATDKLATVFEPFVQVDQRLTRSHEGVGLGLAISRDLARGMGGDLTVVSQPGVGSTFTLTLPAASDSLPV